MANKIGKISAIKRSYTNSQQKTLQGGLAEAGLTRIPGTGVFFLPYKETGEFYRTGLDPDASYIQRIKDPTEKKVEVERVTALRDKLQKIFVGIDLSPTSSFWNYSKAQGDNDANHVSPVKLQDGDNLFDFSNPRKELAFAWLRVYPSIASSMSAWERGEYPADTQFYVADDEVENNIKFKKNQLINKAIILLDDMTPDKKRKVARVLGLPVTDDTKEEIVYNLLNDILKKTELTEGDFKGSNPVTTFTRFATMNEQLLAVKDVVKQAIIYSIYRIRESGRVYNGTTEVSPSEEELVTYLIKDENQEELLILQDQIKSKKLAGL